MNRPVAALTDAAEASAASAASDPKPAVARRGDGWIAFGLSFVWLWITAWARPLSLPDEGRYVGVAWEGLQHGDWLVPTLNGLPFFHKPPLFYWITEASMAIFGPGVWAARAAPLVGGLVGVTIHAVDGLL